MQGSRTHQLLASILKEGKLCYRQKGLAKPPSGEMGAGGDLLPFHKGTANPAVYETPIQHAVQQRVLGVAPISLLPQPSIFSW